MQIDPSLLDAVTAGVNNASRKWWQTWGGWAKLVGVIIFIGVITVAFYLTR